MCGLAGILKIDDNSLIDKNLLDRMTDVLVHRGPDGRGTYTDDHIGLGHRRLAIIDIDGGQQPWIEHNGRYVLVYNGEVYNFKRLRNELEAIGEKFRSNCDTEVVAKSIINWGIEKSVNKFRGMFAIAFWDKLERKLILARDHLGVKPLYWGIHNGLLRFGSEIKTILEDESFPRHPDITSLMNYLGHYRLSFKSRTLFKNINEVLPGSFIIWQDSQPREVKYWRLPLIPESEKEDPGDVGAVQIFREKLTKAVERRLIADVTVGAYLSGGIDSSVIVSLMKQLNPYKVHTYSIGFENDKYNEFAYSSIVAKVLKIPHKVVVMTDQGYFQELEGLIKLKDNPLSVPNEVPLRFLSRVLCKKLKVVLSGEGADELLGGYTMLVRSPHDFRLMKQISTGNHDLSPDDIQRIQKSHLNVYGTTDRMSQKDQFLRLYQWIPRDQRDSLMLDQKSILAAEEEISDFWSDEWHRFDDGKINIYERVLHILEEFHLSALLMRLDATTMAESVEGRVPFTDIDLVEAANALPLKYKIRWKNAKFGKEAKRLTAMEVAGTHDINKYILRQSFYGAIPDVIALRPKTAFPVPLDQWFFGNYQGWAYNKIFTNQMGQLFNLDAIREFLNSAKSKDEGMKMWMLTNVGIWLNSYFGKSLFG